VTAYAICRLLGVYVVAHTARHIAKMRLMRVSVFKFRRLGLLLKIFQRTVTCQTNVVAHLSGEYRQFFTMATRTEHLRLCMSVVHKSRCLPADHSIFDKVGLLCNLTVFSALNCERCASFHLVADGTFNTVTVLQVYAGSKRVSLAYIHALVTCGTGHRLEFDLFMVFRQNIRRLMALYTGGLLRRNHKS